MGLIKNIKKKLFGLKPFNESHFDNEFLQLYYQCSNYTMTSVERMKALYDSVYYILRNNIDGDFVECGVWKGGSSLLIALILKKENIQDRKIYLYDTFEGMSEPTEEDISNDGKSAKEQLNTQSKKDEHSIWCFSTLEEVKKNISLSHLNESQVIYVKGKVEETIPNSMPQSNIALLRLDTDWYESTKHEMEHLYPKLLKHGVLIIDDYGHWAGAKKAIDEYFNHINLYPLLQRIDYTGRLMVKLFD